MTDICKDVGSGGMRCCEIAGCCCAVGKSAGDAGVVNFAGLLGGGKGGLEREGVGFEPGEESRFAEDACVGILGGMDMGVYAFEMWLACL